MFKYCSTSERVSLSANICNDACLVLSLPLPESSITKCYIMLCFLQDQIRQYNLFNCEHIASTKFTFIFSLSPCIIQGNDTYMVKDQKEVTCTFIVQAKGIQLEFNTSWMSVYKSYKPDSKAGAW